jgi:hypothetical protein
LGFVERQRIPGLRAVKARLEVARKLMDENSCFRACLPPSHPPLGAGRSPTRFPEADRSEQSHYQQGDAHQLISNCPCKDT